MAFTQADVDSLKGAIATGAREVRYADGRTVAYRTIPEMVAALQLMESDIAGPRSLAQDRVATGYVSNLSRGTPVFGPGQYGTPPDGGGCW